MANQFAISRCQRVGTRPRAPFKRLCLILRAYGEGGLSATQPSAAEATAIKAFLNWIVTTGDTMHVFNGICGAESGSVPVSASAPAMLFSEIEVQKREHSHERPPLLPPPGLHDNVLAPPTALVAQPHGASR